MITIKQWLQVPSNVSQFLPSFIQLSSLIGSGGQGVVYRGTVNGVDAAIKIYFPNQVTKRIDREIRALQEIDIYSIVKWLWSDRVQFPNHELNVVATSFVEGTELDKMIKNGPLSQHLLGIIAYDVAAAIEAMWMRGTVHRDLKPNNIMLTAKGRACVIDLGIARHVDESSLTQMGGTYGTEGYLSPEQARFVRKLTSKSDIYALGVILIECSMGKHPSNRDQADLQILNLHEQPPSVLGGWKYAPLLKRMVHPRATARPRPEELLEELANYSPSAKE